MKVQKNFRKHKKGLMDFLSQDKDVKIAYLFGSLAKEESNKLSDVDIGVFLDENLSKRERSKKKIYLINEISSILKTDNLDVVVMNDASYRFNFNIIKHGNILFSEESIRIFLENKIMSEYMDKKYYDERHYRILMDKVSRNGLL